MADDNDETHVLHTEPSFAIYSNEDKFGDVEGDNELRIKDNYEGAKLERTATIGESIDPEFSFGRRSSMEMIKEDVNESDSNNGRIRSIVDNGWDFDAMIRENPTSPLALRSIAQCLESKGDIPAAEEYYSHAIVADPEDSETLSQYATLVWEVHGDWAKASSYFERATKAAPDDSNVLAAYANFLWKIDEDEEEDDDKEKESGSNPKVNENAIPVSLPEMDFKEEKRPSSPPLHLAMGLGIDAISFQGNKKEVEHITSMDEEHYRRMVDEDPFNPFFLRNYAAFLHQSKGDLRGAEEYYSRAILADPSNGQTYTLYADIIWQLHQDKDRALAYFKQAIQTAPEDSNVLAAYAKFLWEKEAEDTNANEEAHNIEREKGEKRN